MTKAKRTTLFVLVLLAICGGCTTVPQTYEAKQVLSSQVDEAVAVFKRRDPEIKEFFDGAYGYAVFPKVFKGAFLVGGAHGKGQVYERGEMVGYSTLSQATIGFSFGGEYFREIIFFREKKHFDQFTSEEYVFSAQATGVALTAGAAAKADYEDGKAVFVIAEKGLMVDASLGGQKFKYTDRLVAED
jgi:lipid-binding SYLF domain-containing protein